jgi:hypothetical protein
MPKQGKTKGEKQIKKSTSKKKDQKQVKNDEEIIENLPKEKSPNTKNRPSSVKKNVAKGSTEKTPAAQQSKQVPSAKKKKLTSVGRKKAPKKFSETSESKKEVSEEEVKEVKNSKKTKSLSKSKSRSRSRSKSKSETSQKVSNPTESNKSTPSKESGDTSSKNRRKEASTGRLKEPTYHPPKRQGKGKRGVSPSPPGGKKIQASKVKESSSNIESSSSIDLSAEQKKRSGTEKISSVKSTSREKIGPETERIHAEVENVIKKIEDKKRIRKGDEKLLDKKRKRDKSTALVTHTAKDFDYILQKNPNAKSKPFINLEDLSKKPLINYSDILLSLIEVGQNAESYLFPFSSKSKCFWADVLEYKVLKKIFVDFKAETLRKYWHELSKYDAESTTDLIKKNKSYLDKVPLKLGTIVSSITKLLKGEIKDLKEYIEAIKLDIRKKEIFEHEYENPKTHEKTRVKDIKITYQPRKRYEPGNVKDFKGTVMNVILLKEVYHQNPTKSEFQKVMTNLKKEDSDKFTYINEKIEDEKKKVNTINEEDKFVFKAIDNVVEALSSEFKAYSPEFILETLRQNSMDISKTYACLKEPMKSKTIGFTSLDDMVLRKKTGEEYKILLKEKGKEAIQEREEFLNH